ncbi:hypothetical protein ES288_D05G393700v1 [Gossypium darwinii]|uniref:Uncharacterized protein n=1 Tax=Gossypium darwinii TaxID=34276 RepID=A0A5D2CS15_GOSDA|nr:hypothetical protein ES288_D05G393700v1 [Gossypium darwinii]
MKREDFGNKPNLYKKKKLAKTPIKCGDNDTVIVPLVRTESCKMHQENRMNYTHLGLKVVGIKRMTRLDLGAHVIMTIFDAYGNKYTQYTPLIVLKIFHVN